MNRHVAASVHQRLLNHARAEGRPFNEVLQRFALERFLYRLGCSSYQRKFVLKGALMLTVQVIAGFLQPVIQALYEEQPFDASWPPGGPWS